jgi:hypothetical protein
MENDDPPRVNYGFKDREFKRDNRLTPGTPPMPTAKELAVISDQNVPVVRKPVSGPKPGDPNDVYVTLEENRAVERKTGKDAIEIRKIKSRRRRDYWLLLIPSELLLGLITWYGRGNPIVMVSAFAGMVLVGITLTWVMFQVMNDY